MRIVIRHSTNYLKMQLPSLLFLSDSVQFSLHYKMCSINCLPGALKRFPSCSVALYGFTVQEKQQHNVIKLIEICFRFGLKPRGQFMKIKVTTNNSFATNLQGITSKQADVGPDVVFLPNISFLYL